MRRRNGQASILLAGLAVVLVATSIGLVGTLRVRSDRVRAQRIADAAGLVAVRTLLNGLTPAQSRRAVIAYVKSSASDAVVESFHADSITEEVTVVVRLASERVGLPRIVGQSQRLLEISAIARAAPGEPESGDTAVAVGLSGRAPRGPGDASSAGIGPPLLVSGLPDGTDLTRMPLGVPPVYAPLLTEAAQERGLPVALLAAQLAQESGFDPSSLSPAGAAGIAQFMPGTWAGAWNPWRNRSAYEPRFAIRAQALYVRALVIEFRRNIVRALAAYNAGSSRTSAAASTWPTETQAYVRTILGMLRAGDVTTHVASGVLLLAPVPRLTG